MCVSWLATAQETTVNNWNTAVWSDIFALESNIDQAQVQQFKTKLIAAINQFEQGSAQPGKQLKMVKKLFNHLQYKYLYQYDGYARMSDIFLTGKFNCVTASLMYAFALDYLGVRYDIKILPTHVYLVAYPDGKAVRLETTDPQGGFFAADDKFKARYEVFLQEQGLKASENGSLFDSYYFNDEQVTIEQLSGALYYNFGIEALENEALRDALAYFQAAQSRYDNKQVDFLIGYCLESLVHQLDWAQLTDWDLLINLVNDYPRPSNLSSAEHFFQTAAEHYMIRQGDARFFEEVYAKLSTELRNQNFQNSCRAQYHHAKAQAYYYSYSYQLAINESTKALSIETENLKYKHLLSESVAAQLSTITDYEEGLASTEQYLNAYPFVEQNPYISAYKVTCMLGIASNKFQENDFSSGESLVSGFESKFNDNFKGQIPQEVIASTYAEAAVFHIRQNQFEEARLWLKRGMQYAPSSNTLRRKLASLDN
jgi:hypothetical protein